MKDILINYPIKFLQLELINIRTSYRLEKKKIIEILKDMKSIKKLTKDELIDLLIKYNYDISKLPKLEDLIKPNKEPKPKKEPTPKKEPKPKKEEINNIFKDIPKLDDVFKDIDKKDKFKHIINRDPYKYTDKDKQYLKDIIKKMYEIIDKYDVIKKDLLFIKDEIINLVKLNNQNIDYNYNDFIDEYLLSRLYTALNDLKEDRFNVFDKDFNDIIKNTIDSYDISKYFYYSYFFDIVVYNNLTNDNFNIELVKKNINNTIERNKKLLKRKEELEKRKEELKPKEPEPEIKKFMIKKKSVSPDDFIKMRDDFDSNTYEWTKQAYKEGLTDTEILSYSSLGENEYKLLNAFFTPDTIIEDMLDFSYIYENIYQALREMFWRYR